MAGCAPGVCQGRPSPAADACAEANKCLDRQTCPDDGACHHSCGPSACFRVRCSGPLRVLVRKKGDKLGKLRFKARKGPLKVSLAPGRQIIRRVQLTKPQQHPGKKRGFSVRWGGGTPVRVTAKK